MKVQIEAEIDDRFIAYKEMADEVSNQLCGDVSRSNTTILLYDIRLLYKRLDDKDEDIQILNTLIGNR